MANSSAPFSFNGKNKNKKKRNTIICQKQARISTTTYSSEYIDIKQNGMKEETKYTKCFGQPKRK